MFDICKYCTCENKKCAFAAGRYCGLAIGENRIEFMKACPVEEKKKKEREKK